jgi:cytochrome c-type protein NapC
MVSPQALVIILIAVCILFILPAVIRPSIIGRPEGRLVGLLAFFILPVIAAGIGATEHFEGSKQTHFCLSCHIMEPWGKSLYYDDQAHIPAAHFQNHRIDPDLACYTCHSDYGMYGTLRTKLGGMHHVYVFYLGHPMNPIHLYHPFPNANCLHCHEGARAFESDALHTAIMADLKSEKLSCISSGCHDAVHNTDTLDQQKFWTPAD